MRDKLLTVLLGIAIFLFIITASIALPIYCRFFYYLHINALNIPEITGYDYTTIKEAYNQVLNYLTIPGAEFSTGVFAYTQAGMAHFEDCKGLFNLNVIVLISSFAVMLTLLILNKKQVITLSRPFGMHVGFISALSIFTVALVLIGLVSINFDKAFVIFHKIFFPGKDNWMFGPGDQIINALPQQFFMNCAILIASSIVITCSTIIIVQLIKRKKSQTQPSE